MTPAELFTRAGVALYGDEFVAPLARLLKVRDDTVRKMADGKSRVAPGMWAELTVALMKRHAEGAKVLYEIQCHQGDLVRELAEELRKTVDKP